MLYVELYAEVFELHVVELLVIIYNYDARQAKSIDNGLPDEIFSLCFGDLGHWFNFYPFSEVINGYKEKLSLPDTCENGPRMSILH